MTEYLSENFWQVWAAASVLCLLLELSSGSFYILCFAVGALLAALCSAFCGVPMQLLLFIVGTVVSLFTVRPLAMKYFHRGGTDRVSNADAIIGRTGTVSQTINAGGYGRVAIDGDDWKAEAAGGETISEGQRVRVVGRESLIIKVEKS